MLCALTERLPTPDLIAGAIHAVEAELSALQRDSADTRHRLERELSEVHRKLEGMVRAIEDGGWNDTLRQLRDEPAARKAELTGKLPQAANPAPIVQLHPGPPPEKCSSLK